MEIKLEIEEIKKHISEILSINEMRKLRRKEKSILKSLRKKLIN
jgi:hypothetical protein